MKYTFDLDNDSNDNFERNGDNICRIYVFDKDKKIINNCTVQIFLSKNGLIGMGTELIRLAHKFYVGKHIHMDPPSEKEDIVQRLGVYLTPESTPTIVLCEQGEDIDEILEQDKKLLKSNRDNC